MERAHFGSLQEGMCLLHPDTPRTPFHSLVLLIHRWSLVLGDKAQSGPSFVSLVWVSLLSSPTEINDRRIKEWPICDIKNNTKALPVSALGSRLVSHVRGDIGRSAARGTTSARVINAHTSYDGGSKGDRGVCG